MAKQKKKIEISLTDFIDYVNKAGTSKLTKVKQLKDRGTTYHPAKDFYKALREGIVENHQKRGEKKDLDKIIQTLKDEKKKKNYTEAIAGYKKFWGRKSINYFEPAFKHWIIGDLNVRINPELGIEYNEMFYIVKLYLKSDRLTKDRVAQVLTLMEKELRNADGVEDEVKMALLDVKNSRLYVKEDNDLSLDVLLSGEARALQEIWNAIS